MNRTDEEIRASVSEAYARRVRPVLDEGPDAIPLIVVAGPGDACETSGCCGGEADAEEQALTNIARLYAGTDLEGLPSSVTDVAFGCGNPTAIDALRPGETVLDLGSGGGIDCFLAAKQVGEGGRVFGVDMTPEMIELARRNAARIGATNVEFRQSTIEHLPFAEAEIDVIISNCVINLSPDKDQVFREAFRVLRPGGRIQVSDIVWTRPVPEAVKNDMEQWAGCIAGALQESDYLASIAAAGFEEIRSRAVEYPDGRGIASANVIAYKPGA